jgi:hypothetical protein
MGEGSVAAPSVGVLRRVGLFAVVLGIAGLVAAVRRAAATARDTPRGALSRA